MKIIDHSATSHSAATALTYAAAVARFAADVGLPADTAEDVIHMKVREHHRVAFDANVMKPEGHLHNLADRDANPVNDRATAIAKFHMKVTERLIENARLSVEEAQRAVSIEEPDVYAAIRGGRR